MDTSQRPAGVPIEILLVEDNPGDIRLTQEGFKECRVQNHIHVARDGVEAMDFLKQSGEHENAPRPDLILLDLNLPKMSGHEILAEIKKDEELRSIPVIVLTTSSTHEDILASYDLQASSFITKPVEFTKFLEVLKELELYWLSVVKLPDARSKHGVPKPPHS